MPPITLSYTFSVLSGVALALTLPKPGLCWLAWLAPAGLFWELKRAKTPRRAAGLAFAFGFAYAGVALHWIYLTCRFAGLIVPVALLAWAALAAFLALGWALFGALGFRVRGSPWALAALWAGIEFALASWTPRLPADLLAYSQWRYLPMLQATSVFGPYALGFLIVLWNAALASREKRQLVPAGALVLAWAGYGLAAMEGDLPPGARVEILQPNIDQYQKWDEDFEASIRRRFEELLAKPREAKPALIVWPESALPGWLEDPALADWAAGLARKARAPMLVGAISGYGGRNHNSAALFDASGRITDVYHKRQLVPFGEFVPLRGLLQPWIGILAQMGDFVPGDRAQRLMDAGFGPVAATVCYETVFPRWPRIDAGRGARVVANLTNDGWYKDTWGPWQHFHANVFRAVENRVTVVRAANTGISGVIDPYGRVLARTALNVPARLDVALPADRFPRGSFYARAGDWFGWLCLLAAAGALLAGRRRS